MADDDKRISELYRGLPRDEPPAALDAAVVAAARRAVASRLRSWYVPVSLAAVVVLSVAVTLRIQHEQPDFEATAPAAKAVPPDPAPAAPAPKDEPRLIARPGAEQRSAVVGVEARKPAAKLLEAPSPATRPAPAFVPDPESAKREASAAREDRAQTGSLAVPAPQASAEVASQAGGASAPRGAMGAASAPRDAAVRERQEPIGRQASPAASPETAKQLAVAEPPERWLERIAELRRLARHKEADESLAEFRKRHPDYRIAQDMLEKVQPR